MRRTSTVASRLAAVLVSLGLVAIVAIVATPASASPAWSVAKSPSPPGPQSGTLWAVACPSKKSCVAVGDQAGAALAQRWNGAGWSAVPIPLPSGASSVHFSAVACASATSCFAVGTYSIAAGDRGLVEHWNGSRWSFVATPRHGASGPFLHGVACPSAKSCFAVANELVEHWNGSKWLIQSRAKPLGASAVFLDGVACASTTSCFAVGVYTTKSFADKTLIEHWNGKTWSVATGVKLPGATSDLEGVSCATATRCVAVGGPLVAQWNGKTWVKVAIPRGAGLRSVSCPSSTRCLAAGGAFALQWNGKRWSKVASPKLGSSELNGVACLSASSCYVVGANAQFTFVAHWNGKTWSIGGPLAASSQSSLSRVACASATTCFAFGTASTGIVDQSLTEQWNGASWSIITVPKPPGATAFGLSGASCPTATNCFAVGSALIGSTYSTLVEQWNGTSWSVVAAPNPAGAASSDLIDVSCVTATSCIAVGSDATGSTPQTLVEQWDGANWSIVASPNPAGAISASLSGVSCASATSCVAVGGSLVGHSPQTLVEQWDGTSWSIATSPSPNAISQLSAVSCISASSCFAVGGSEAPSTTWPYEAVESTLIEKWDGSTWALDGPAAAGGLSGIACPSATSCVAVGTSTVATSETWDGTSWAVVGTPHQAGAARSNLGGVSCPSPTSCVAVGGYSTPVSRYTLIERYA